jgi:hypothetical protein
VIDIVAVDQTQAGVGQFGRPGGRQSHQLTVGSFDAEIDHRAADHEEDADPADHHAPQKGAVNVQLGLCSSGIDRRDQLRSFSKDTLRDEARDAAAPDTDLNRSSTGILIIVNPASQSLR